MEQMFDRIYEGRPWRKNQLTRKQPHQNYRHIVRYFSYNRSPLVTLEQVAVAEAILLRRKPVGHESIINSLRVVAGMKKDRLFEKISGFSDEILRESPRNELFKYFKSADPQKQLQIVYNLLPKLNLAQREWLKGNFKEAEKP